MDSISRGEKADALAAIGLREEEFRTYEHLLEHPGATLAEVAAAMGLSIAHARHWVQSVERKGLASRSAERPPRYRATSPDLSFGTLVAKRQIGLQAALALAGELGRRKPRNKDADEDELTVELITGRDALLRTIEHIHHSAKNEILELDRPPYLNTYQQHDAMREPVIRRSVSFRTVVDTRGLDVPGRTQHVRDSIAAGEQIRVYDGVPIKAAIIDRRFALVPLHLKSASDSGLLLRQSLLVDVLCAYFEMLWEAATPFALDLGIDLGTPRNGLAGTSDQEQLVVLLANGLKDKAVAQRLKVSERTLERRIADLQKRLRAATRFQAGWRAALRAMERQRPT